MALRHRPRLLRIPFVENALAGVQSPFANEYPCGATVGILRLIRAYITQREELDGAVGHKRHWIIFSKVSTLAPVCRI